MRRYQNAYSHWSRGFQVQSASAKYQHRTNPYGPSVGMLAQQPTGRHTFRRTCKTNPSQLEAESAAAIALFPDDLQESFLQGTLTFFSSGQVKKDDLKKSALKSLSISQNHDRMAEVLSPEPVALETPKWKWNNQYEQSKVNSVFTVFPKIYSRSQLKKRGNNLKSIANVDTNKQKLPECTENTEPDKVPDELFQDWTKEIETGICTENCLINSNCTVSQSKQLLSQVNGVSDCKYTMNEINKDMIKPVIFTAKEDNKDISEEIASDVVSSGDWLNTRKYHAPYNINAVAFSENVGRKLEVKVSDSCARQNASQSVMMHVKVEQDRNTCCLKSSQPNTQHMDNNFVSSVDHNGIVRFQKEEKVSPGLDGQSEDMFPNTPEENHIPPFLENKSVINKYATSLIHEKYTSDNAENFNDFPCLDQDGLICPSQNIGSRRFSSTLVLKNNGKNDSISDIDLDADDMAYPSQESSNVDLDADDMVYPSQESNTCFLNKVILPCKNQIKRDPVAGSNFINNEVVIPSRKTQQSRKPKDSKVTIKVFLPCQNQTVDGGSTAGSHFTKDEAVFSSGKRQMLGNIEDSKAQSDDRYNFPNQQNSSEDEDEAVPPSHNSDTTKLLEVLPDIHKFIVPSVDIYTLPEDNDNLSLYSEEKTFPRKIKRYSFQL